MAAKSSSFKKVLENQSVGDDIVMSENIDHVVTAGGDGNSQSFKQVLGDGALGNDLLMDSVIHHAETSGSGHDTHFTLTTPQISDDDADSDESAEEMYSTMVDAATPKGDATPGAAAAAHSDQEGPQVARIRSHSGNTLSPDERRNCIIDVPLPDDTTPGGPGARATTTDTMDAVDMKEGNLQVAEAVVHFESKLSEEWDIYSSEGLFDGRGTKGRHELLDWLQANDLGDLKIGAALIHKKYTKNTFKFLNAQDMSAVMADLLHKDKIALSTPQMMRLKAAQAELSRTAQAQARSKQHYRHTRSDYTYAIDREFFETTTQTVTRIGGSRVGKSSIKDVVLGRQFDADKFPTIRMGAHPECYVTAVGSDGRIECRYNVWDCPGQKALEHIPPLYLTGVFHRSIENFVEKSSAKNFS